MKPVSSLRNVTAEEIEEKKDKLESHKTLSDAREINEFKTELVRLAVNVPLSPMRLQVTREQKEIELYTI